MNSRGSLLAPFDLENQAAYGRWRDNKLKSAPKKVHELIVPFADQRRPSLAEIQQIKALCRHANMAVYDGLLELKKSDVLTLTAEFGLRQVDLDVSDDQSGVSAIRVVEADKYGDKKGFYIPYSTRSLGWHTDGYYNDTNTQIRAFILHCVQEAVDGGDSQFLDHEIAYIRMRDENPAFVAAMMQSDAMTIPANDMDKEGRREARTGPVFSIIEGKLHMRYTARSREIIWKKDKDLDRARTFLVDLMASDDEFVLKHQLRSGQGVVCNNVLHRRTSFEDSNAPDNRRLLYRARFFDRIQAPPNTADSA